MPTLRPASIRVVPFSTSTWRSSMVTIGMLVLRSLQDRERRLAVTEVRLVRGALLLELGEDLVAELLDDRADAHHRGVAERAERVAADLLRHARHQVDVLRHRLAVRDVVEKDLHPVGALAAGGALAARL